MKILFVESYQGKGGLSGKFDRKFLFRLCSEGHIVNLITDVATKSAFEEKENFSCISLSKHTPFTARIVSFVQLTFFRYDVIDFQGSVPFLEFVLLNIFHPHCSLIVHYEGSVTRKVSFIERFILRHIDRVIVPSKEVRWSLKRQGVKGCSVIPMYKSFAQKPTGKIGLFQDFAVREKQYIILSFSRESSLDDFVKVLRAYERMLKTNRVPNNIAFVVVTSNSTKEQDLLLYTLALSQPLLFVYEAVNEEEKRNIIAKSLLLIAFRETPRSEKEDALGFGIPVLSLGTRSHKKMCTYTSTLAYSDICDALSFIFNLPHEEIEKKGEKEKRKIRKMFQFSVYVHKNTDIYQECIASKRAGKLSWSIAHIDQP